MENRFVVVNTMDCCYQSDGFFEEDIRATWPTSGGPSLDPRFVAIPEILHVNLHKTTSSHNAAVPTCSRHLSYG